MAILLAILKTILKILLIIIALIIILILLILFVPFRYRAAGVKEPGAIEAEASVTWLLHLLTVEVAYSLTSGKRLTKDIRIFGISLFKVKKWLSERKKSKAEKEKEKRRLEKKKKLEQMKEEDPERYEQLRQEALARKREERRKKEEEEKKKEEERLRREAELAAKEALQKKKEEEEALLKKNEEEEKKNEQGDGESQQVAAAASVPKPDQTLINDEPAGSSSEGSVRKIRKIYVKALSRFWRIAAKIFTFFIKFILMIWNLPGRIISVISGVFKKVKSVTSKMGSIFTKFSDIMEFLQDEHTQEVLSLLKKQIGRLIRHILPRSLTGYLRYGLEDPYLTGRVLATACAFYPLYGKTFRLEPDFEELVFNCRAELKGRIFLFYLAFIALSTYFNKNTKFVINYIKSFKNKEEAE